MGRGIFINYRGEDSHSYGALLYTELARQFGGEHVFLDAESIPAGADFVEELLTRVRSAQVLLAVIGSRWLTATDPAGRRRIDNPCDWIRRELAEAFTAGIRVIPVLTDDAELPREAELPDDIAALGRCQYRHLRCREPTADLARIVTDLTNLDPALAASTRNRGNASRQPPTQPAQRSGERMLTGSWLGRRFSRFDRDYRTFVSRAQRFIDVKGLTIVGPYTPELDEVFVDLSVMPRIPADIPTGLVSDDPVDGFTRHVLVDFLDQREPSVIAIIGGPGTGKTTLLLHTARRACARHGRRTVPILLFLRDHKEKILANPDITLLDVLRSTLGPLQFGEPKDWFDRHLAGGHCMVLLDGLDEVGGQAHQRAMAHWVERQIHHHPGNDYVITSRPHGYRAARIDGATVLNPLRLTDEQVTHLVSGWFHAFESSRERYNRPSGGNRSTGAQDAAQRAATSTRELLGRLFRAPELYDLTANPMLLTMIVNVHQFLGQLPGSRADLYAEICRVMLGNRQAAKDLPVEPPVDKKEMVLRGLAYSMMCEHVRDMPQDDVVDTIQPLLDRLPHAVTARDFLADVGSSGVLVERENGLFAFAHHSFQEYLASAHVREKGLVDVLTNMVDDVWWREVTLLYAAKSDADPIVRTCLASSSVAALSLVFDCDAQITEIAPDLRLRVRQLLDSAVDRDTDPQLRRLMVGALVSRHLRRFVRTADGGRVCAQPVPVKLYRLSLRESLTQTPDEPWLLEPGGDEPVRGVYGREALRFVNWVNTMGAPDVTCRLPTKQQLDDPVVSRALHAYATAATATAWLHPEPGHDPELWSPQEHRHPHTVERDTMIAHLTRDVTELTTTLAGLLLLRAVVYLPAIARARAAALASGTRWDGDSLTDELARTLDIAGHQDDTIDLTRAQKLLHDTDDDTIQALNRSRARSRTRNVGMDIMTSIARVAEKGGTDIHPHVPAAAASTPDGGVVNERTRQLATELAGRLDDVRGRCDIVAHTLTLDLAFGQGESLATEFSRYLARIGGLDDLLTNAVGPVSTDARAPLATLTRIASTWLGQAVSCGLCAKEQPFHASVTQSLIDQLDGLMAPRTVRPDRLADQVRQVTAHLRAAAPVRRDAPQCWHPIEVAQRLESLALTVFSWQEPLMSSQATAIRLAALCLAVEVRPAMPELAETLADIAAGATLLQRRTDGRAQLTETIVLAVS